MDSDGISMPFIEEGNANTRQVLWIVGCLYTKFRFQVYFLLFIYLYLLTVTLQNLKKMLKLF